MSEYLIREATDEDGGDLVALLAREWSAYDGCTFEAEADVLVRPASHFAERDGRLWLLMRSGETAGALAIARGARANEFELSLICLERDARGQGLATALLAGANAFAEASGGERLNVWVDERLIDGVRFLDRRKFLRDPGVRRRDDRGDALDAHFSRAIEPPVSSRPSEDPPAGAA